MSPVTSRFIVVSGAGVMTDVVEALHLGASDFLVKPIVDLEVLEYAIGRTLEKSRLLEENKRYRASLEEANTSLTSSLSLLQEDQKAGRQVQMDMLPDKPLEFRGFKIDHRIIPSLYLSGDFVDYFQLNERSFCFLSCGCLRARCFLGICDGAVEAYVHQFTAGVFCQGE